MRAKAFYEDSNDQVPVRISPETQNQLHLYQNSLNTHFQVNLCKLAQLRIEGVGVVTLNPNLLYFMQGDRPERFSL